MLPVVAVPCAADDELLCRSPFLFVIPRRSTPGLVASIFHFEEVLKNEWKKRADFHI